MSVPTKPPATIVAFSMAAGSFRRRSTPVEVSTATAPPVGRALALDLPAPSLTDCVLGATSADSATALAAFASSSSAAAAGLGAVRTAEPPAPGFLVPHREQAG